MRVLLHANAATGARTGVGHYTAELLRALGEEPSIRVFSYPNPHLARIRERLGGGRPPAGWDGGTAVVASPGAPPKDYRFTLRHITRTPLRLGWRLIMATYLRAAFDPRLVDLYHEPNFFPLRTRLPTVVTVHDLSAVLHPEWHPASRVALFEKEFLPRISEIAHVLTVSDAARAEIIRTFNLPPERVTRAYNGVRVGLRSRPAAEIAPTLRRLGLPDAYFLHVGTLEPRKNLLMLMQAYAALPGDLRARCPMVLAGTWGWRFEQLAGYFESIAKHRNVIHLGYVAEEDLPAVYGGARALVFPTWYEGFGMPAAEMLARGGAVLASDTPAVAEVLGSCGYRIDPADADGWQSAMRRAITDDDWIMTLRVGTIERAAEFTWANCARDTVAGYVAALGSRRSTPRIHTKTEPIRPTTCGPCGASSTSTTTRPTISAGPKS
jgi:glycosyltransferase involved in cell wall biosynthesis